MENEAEILDKDCNGKEHFEASSHCCGGSISKMVKVPSIISVDSFIEQILGQLFLVWCTVYSIDSCVCTERKE